jgi:protein-tyrosine phosphatase
MTTAEPFVDIHCHMLPGIDDGAKSLDEALAMAEMAVADGIGTIVATPHQLGSHAKNTGEAIRAAATAFQRELERRQIPLQVLPGADVRIEPDLPRKIRTGEVVSLGDHRRHVLLELPHDVYVPLDRLLADLAATGLVGILSHPERNRGILSQPDVLRPLVERGCLLQVTAASLLGTFGSQPEKLATSLIEQGLVHFVSTDAHSTHGRPPKLRAAFDRIVELAGEDAARDVCCRHPAAVAAGGIVTPGCRRPVRRTWTGWLSRTFSLERVAAKPIV